MAEVNGQQPGAASPPPQISPFLQITVTEAGPVMNSNITDGGMLIALLEQTKLFVLNRLFQTKPPLIQKVNGAMNRMLHR